MTSLAVLLLVAVAPAQTPDHSCERHFAVSRADPKLEVAAPTVIIEGRLDLELLPENEGQPILRVEDTFLSEHVSRRDEVRYVDLRPGDEVAILDNLGGVDVSGYFDEREGPQLYADVKRAEVVLPEEKFMATVLRKRRARVIQQRTTDEYAELMRRVRGAWATRRRFESSDQRLVDLGDQVIERKVFERVERGHLEVEPTMGIRFRVNLRTETGQILPVHGGRVFARTRRGEWRQLDTAPSFEHEPDLSGYSEAVLLVPELR